MARQLTIRNVPDEVGRRLDRLSRDRGESLNTTLVAILTNSVEVNARGAHLERYATWTEEDAAAFDRALDGQRAIDPELWR